MVTNEKSGSIESSLDKESRFNRLKEHPKSRERKEEPYLELWKKVRVPEIENGENAKELEGEKEENASGQELDAGKREREHEGEKEENASGQELDAGKREREHEGENGENASGQELDAGKRERDHEGETGGNASGQELDAGKREGEAVLEAGDNGGEHESLWDKALVFLHLKKYPNSCGKEDEPDLEELTNRYVQEIIDSKWPISTGWIKYPGMIFRYLNIFREETYHDWLTVKIFADMAVYDYENQEDKEKKEKRDALAKIRAYLKLARHEKDYSYSWSYINLADAYLPLVVPDEAFDACLMRLKTWDEEIPGNFNALLTPKMSGPDEREAVFYLRGLLHEEDQDIAKSSVRLLGRMGPKANDALPDLIELVDSDDEVFKENVVSAIQKINNKTIIIEKPQGDIPMVKRTIQKGKVGKPDSPRKPNYRYSAFHDQLQRALLWNAANARISLKITLLHKKALGLFLMLLVSVSVIQSIYHLSGQEDPIVPLHFFVITLMGFLGGGLSAALIARDVEIKSKSYQLILAYSHLRILLGGAGAFVVYIIAQCPGFLAENIGGLINDELFVFLSLGIAAGFSERLFITSIENVSKNLRMGGDNKSRK